MAFLIFLYLAIFPFGRLLGNVSDVIVLIICIFSFLLGYRFKINNFVLICLFSLIFSISFFKVPELFTGLLYLIRFISYVIFSQVVYQKFGRKEKTRKLIFNSMILVGVAIAVFGWIQYFVFPDFRFLRMFNW